MTPSNTWEQQLHQEKEERQQQHDEREKTQTLSEWYVKNKKQLQEQYAKKRTLEITRATEERLEKDLERERIRVL